MDKTDFDKLVTIVINNFEGGYYHPDMLADGRIKDSRYAGSGETMFGIDRVAGAELNKTEAGKKFWQLIDNANARKLWKWNYLGGDLAPQLKALVGDMLLPQFQRLSGAYLTPGVKAVVDNDKRLTLHFVYACWNGAGWFKKFATDLNTAFTAGIQDADGLALKAIDSRTTEGLKPGSPPNSLIKQHGLKMQELFKAL